MNEKLLELAKQAGYKHPDAVGLCEDYAYFAHEKFAKLIVRECAELCLNNETFQGMFDTMEYRKGRHFNSIIKEHFGVEE